LPVDRLDMIHPISPSITAPLCSDVPAGWGAICGDLYCPTAGLRRVSP
jgi:hypothetical protein